MAATATPVGQKLSGQAAPRGNTFEIRAWQYMRWSGVLLLPLAFIHLAYMHIINSVYVINYQWVVETRWLYLGWRIYDIALLGFAFGHGMLGLRTVVNDYVHHPGWNRAIKWLMVVGWVVITTIGAIAIVGGVAK